MHDYTIDKHPKEKVLFILAVLAITFSPILQNFVEYSVRLLEVNTAWSSPPVVAIPVFGLFLGLSSLFNKYLWRINSLRRILLVPDLNGSWECEGHTILKDGEQNPFDWSATVNITQSWSKILIHLQTLQSESKSISASIFHEPGVGYRLLYQYVNNPNANELDLSTHSGSAEVLFSEDAISAAGSYFTDRHRTTVGTITLRRRD